MKVADAFFRPAKTVTGVTPTRVTSDGQDSYPRAIRRELGRRVRQRTSRHLTDGLEQDRRKPADRRDAGEELGDGPTPRPRLRGAS